MENVLKKIIDIKKRKIKLYKNKYSENKLFDDIKNIKNSINFKDEIIKKSKEEKISIIAEIKKASPSAGEIINNFNSLEIAEIYISNGVKFLSVLTEEDFFMGKLDDMKNIKKKHKIPILCKDFFIDTYQVPLAKSFGADCILIILSAVDIEIAKDLYQAANDLDLSTIVEVHSEKEAEIASSFENSLIGINNRNLKTLKISLNTSIELSKLLKSHKNPLICESGINTPDDIKFIIENSNIRNFLIGESLLKSENIGLKLKDLLQISV